MPRAPLALCLSRDEGHSFPERIVIEDGPGTCPPNDSTDGRNRELSCRWVLQTADDCLHIAYAFHRRAIRHLRRMPGAGW